MPGFHAVSGRYRVRFADHDEDIAAACHLRFAAIRHLSALRYADHPPHNRRFHSIDFFTVVDLQEMNERTFQNFVTQR